MISAGPDNALLLVGCLICTKPASCRNYGVVSCDACKMFFRRTVVQNMSYSCRNNFRCLEQIPVNTRSMCRACRFQKCLEMGMEFIPRATNILEVENRRNEEFMSIMKDLIAMDSSLYLRLMSFYTEDDPSLEDILERRRVAVARKAPQQRTSSQQWSFFATYIFIATFMNLSFVQQLLARDKKILFRFVTVRICFLRSAMRNMRERCDRIYAPDGQEVYPEEVVRILRVDPLVMKRICSMLVTRMIQLNVTNEEFVLIQLIFFCNPAIPSLSEDAQSILSTHQRMYTSVLFQYCQIKYQIAAPSRLVDLLSLYHLIAKTYEDLHYLVMIFKLSIPNFRIHKLGIETFQLSENMEDVEVRRAQ